MSINKISLQEFHEQLPNILSHIIQGKIKEGRSFGIHFFHASFHQIKEIVREPNLQGVWEARIEVKHPKTKFFVKKRKSSTLFPMEWTEADLAIKLVEAFNNAEVLRTYKYIGATSCGIQIVFIVQQGMISSCYPICN